MTMPSTSQPPAARQRLEGVTAAGRAKVALVSLRFKPAFVSHPSAFGKACQELGSDVELIVDPAYAQFPELRAVRPITAHSGARFGCSYSHALFMNVSLENRRLAARLKSGGTKILYLYHEPWESSRRSFTAEGMLGGLGWALAHHVSVPMLRLADVVILPSRYAADVYRRADVRYNTNACYVPLLFDDETPGRIRENPGGRRYFSCIGAICRTHGFDQYVAFIRESIARKSHLRFLIAFRLLLPSYVLGDSLIKRNLDRIEIRCGRPLGSEEINQCYSESLCVWTLYRRATQSGVLPKAFMFGTPVLASRVGSFPEFIKDKFTGTFASLGDIRAIKMALKDICENIGEYSVNCRKTFLETFFYRSNLPALARLLAN